MPELPEVDTVRSGLARHVAGRTIATVDSLHPRAIRRHEPGAEDLAARLVGLRIESVERRGKYLWFTFADSDLALVLHLGMSGQLLMLEPATPFSPHVRGRFTFTDGGRELRFDDQRTFGGLYLDELVSNELPEGATANVARSRTDGSERVPSSIAHIGRDPLDPAFDDREWIRRTRGRQTTLKRALLDQSTMSGVGNIYADEALWRAKLHGDRAVSTVTPAQLRVLLAELRAVFTDALAAGGTSFDALYVNVNGESGYFDRSLNAYGREGEPCRRCGRPIRRVAWMNRSSYFCPNCQRLPRRTAS